MIGATAKRTLTITNAGGVNLIISLISVSTRPFGVSGITTPSTIAPSGSSTLTVAFSPTTTGTDSGSITITSNDPQIPTMTITLSGTGTPAVVAPTITTPPANQPATADSGSTFREVVSNTVGTVTSAAATLTVNPVPLRSFK